MSDGQSTVGASGSGTHSDDSVHDGGIIFARLDEPEASCLACLPQIEVVEVGRRGIGTRGGADVDNALLDRARRREEVRESKSTQDLDGKVLLDAVGRDTELAVGRSTWETAESVRFERGDENDAPCVWTR